MQWRKGLGHADITSALGHRDRVVKGHDNLHGMFELVDIEN